MMNLQEVTDIKTNNIKAKIFIINNSVMFQLKTHKKIILMAGLQVLTKNQAWKLLQLQTLPKRKY